MNIRNTRLPGGAYFPAGLAVAVATAAILTLPFLSGLADGRKAEMYASAGSHECFQDFAKCDLQWFRENVSNFQFLQGTLKKLTESGLGQKGSDIDFRF